MLVHFRVGTATLDENYMDNKATLTEFANIVKTYYSDSTAHFRQLRVVASVSPEGGKAVNDRLVKQRAEAITKGELFLACGQMPSHCVLMWQRACEL